MEEKGAFQEIVVWGHEAVPEEGDVYVKGMKEWIAFAEAVSIFIPARIAGTCSKGLWS